MTDLRTDADLMSALAASNEEPVVLFKHSRSCPISSAANGTVSTLNGPDDPPVFRIVVQQARELSNRVEQRFGIRHESPQAIVVFRGEPLFHASHFSIRADGLRAAARLGD